jgi:hypothetical protein
METTSLSIYVAFEQYTRRHNYCLLSSQYVH